jgi:hypothetical protein
MFGLMFGVDVDEQQQLMVQRHNRKFNDLMSEQTSSTYLLSNLDTRPPVIFGFNTVAVITHLIIYNKFNNK